MSNPIYSRIYQVTVRTYKWNDEKKVYDKSIDIVSVLADNLEKAIQQGNDCTESWNKPDTRVVYEIEAVSLVRGVVFVGKELDTEEVEIVAETEYAEDHSI